MNNNELPGLDLWKGSRDLRFVMIQGLPDLSEQRRKEMLMLVQRVQPESKNYINSRIKRYHSVILAEDGHGLAAFQFIEQFEVNGDVFIYLGPLFSRGYAFMFLFLQYYNWLTAKYKDRVFHLMAEVQNPEVLLFFKTLFWRITVPRVEEDHIPQKAAYIAKIYAERITHIGRIDETVLSTHSDQTLYKVSKGYEDVMNWLHSRGVHLEQGDSQMLLISWLGNEGDRHSHLQDLEDGLKKLQQWKTYKRLILQCFKEGTAHA